MDLGTRGSEGERGCGLADGCAEDPEEGRPGEKLTVADTRKLTISKPRVREPSMVTDVIWSFNVHYQ